tara:strand:+ start:4761 stop:5150 length:390 start_codon:yes stop_codon:yes gene_type:complete
MTSTVTWFSTPIQWLDARGKGAWIAAMVLGFIFLWPVGLAILFYMLGTNRMSRSFFGCPKSRRTRGATGNAAFDTYKEDTISRLNEEQDAFNGFLQRLRHAKDKTEFDQFMDDRAKQQKSDAKEAAKTA